MPTLQQLASEINSDPGAYGYAAQKSAGSDSGIVALLNGPTKTVNPTVWRTSVAAAELLGCIVWSEVSTFTAVKWAAAQAMLTPGTVDASNANIRAFFAGAFAGATQTIANMTTIAKVAAPTRAEELWGPGTVIGSIDVAKALGRG